MNKKIVIGTNSLTESQYPAYSNHCQFWFRCGRSLPDYDFCFVNPSRMNIDNMRNMAAKIAIQDEAEYLVFLDDDVVVPMNGLQKLIACNTDIAAGNVIIRSHPFNYMFFKRLRIHGPALVPRLEIYQSIEGEPVVITDKNGLGAVGFSFACIRVSLLRKMKPPYFLTTTNTTEDVYFCLKACELFPETTLAVDTSIECGHILWPEIITPKNREAYKIYLETTNPVLQEKKPIEVLQEVSKDQADAMNKLMARMGVKDIDA